MNADWRWKIDEAIHRLRDRYEFIGRKTGAQFLAIVYPAAAERAVFSEWRTQTAALRPDIDVRAVDVFQATERVVRKFGIENLVGALRDPMPGTDPNAELGQAWLRAVVAHIQARAAEPGVGKPVISLERIAALYPATTPRELMHALWDRAEPVFDGPIVVLLPGTLRDVRTYAFLDQREEFMYRGDVL